MKKHHCYMNGHVGLVALIVTFATITIGMVLYFGSLSNEEGTSGETKIQRDMQAIEDAKAVKELIEQRDQLGIDQ
jgi:hypothetical protein